MKATITCLGALAAALVAASAACAQPCYPCPPPSLFGGACAPDMCGPGFYAVNCCGCPYGPNYCVHPCFPPFNGLLPNLPKNAAAQQPCMPGMGGRPPAPCFPSMPYMQPPMPAVPFPTHPYARSPRDYFMIGEDRPDIP